MSVNMNSAPINDPATSESETPMFAAVPAWERTRKRRGPPELPPRAARQACPAQWRKPSGP